MGVNYVQSLRITPRQIVEIENKKKYRDKILKHPHHSAMQLFREQLWTTETETQL